MKIFSALIIAPALTLAFSAEAYETDVHYGLTYWLASKAGYSEQQSHEIARGNELTDTGMLDAKHAIIMRLCLKRDKGASLLTRELHFRSQQEPPAPPQVRPVNYTDSFSYARAQRLSKEGNHQLPESLKSFGEAIHGWQDSHSHQGVSNTFFLCPDEWIWSHPVEMGNEFSHAADQTFKNPKKCENAGESTYQLLRRYRSSMNLVSQPREWTTLSSQVRQFCEASTKEEKMAWLEENGVPQAYAIAKNTSLRGFFKFLGGPRLDLRSDASTTSSSEIVVPEYEVQVPGWLPDIEIEAGLKEFISGPPTAPLQDIERTRSFLKAWLTSPAEKLPATLAPYMSQTPLDQNNENLIQLLRLRLKNRYSDDATINQPSRPINPDDYITYNPENWTTALVPVRGQKNEALVDAEDANNIVMIAILRDAPNEVLIVTASAGFLIKSVDSLIFH